MLAGPLNAIGSHGTFATLGGEHSVALHQSSRVSLVSCKAIGHFCHILDLMLGKNDGQP
jgi:hypothetical protein